MNWFHHVIYVKLKLIYSIHSVVYHIMESCAFMLVDYWINILSMRLLVLIYTYCNIQKWWIICCFINPLMEIPFKFHHPFFSPDKFFILCDFCLFDWLWMPGSPSRTHLLSIRWCATYVVSYYYCMPPVLYYLPFNLYYVVHDLYFVAH